MPPFADDCLDVPRATTINDFRRALDAIDAVLAEHEPIHRGRWRRESVYSHVAHAGAHLATWREERKLLDLEHAAARALMALSLALALDDTRPSEPAP